MYGRKTLISKIFYPTYTCEIPINVNHQEMAFCRIPLGRDVHLPLPFQLETHFFSSNCQQAALHFRSKTLVSTKRECYVNVQMRYTIQ